MGFTKRSIRSLLGAVLGTSGRLPGVIFQEEIRETLTNICLQSNLKFRGYLSNDGQCVQLVLRGPRELMDIQ